MVAPIEPLALLVVQVVVLPVVVSTHQVTFVFVVPETVATSGNDSRVPMVLEAGATDTVMPELSVTVATPVAVASAEETAVMITWQGVVGPSVHVPG